MAERLRHPENDFEAQALLERLQCTPPPLAKLTRGLQPLLLIVLVVVAIAFAFAAGPALAARNLQLDVGNLIIAVGLIIGVSQWKASLEQQAIKDYEAGIATTNAVDSKVCGMMAHHYPKLPAETAPNYDCARYVYVQLDNLEYAVERYMQGLATAYTTARAVMTFENRCQSPEFRERTRLQLPAASYSPVVERVVGHVLESF